MAMILQPSRLRLTQAIYFGHPPGGGTGTVTAVGGGNGITATPGPIVAVGNLDLGPLTADWNSGTNATPGPHYDINGHNTTRIFNVRDYGALGNSIADDSVAIQAAVDAAKATRGTVYFPRSNGYYRVSTTINVQDATGINIVGEGPLASQIAATVGSVGLNVLNIFSNIGSGSVRDVVIRDLGITADSAGLALRIWNCLHFSIENVYLIFGIPALSIQGSGNGILSNVQAYGGLNVGHGGGLLTNSGPLIFDSGQFQTSVSATPAVVLSGDLLGIEFNTCQFQANGGTHAATVQIDGGISGIGSVEFNACHGESNYNSTNTGVDFLIGSITKFGHVGFYGGNYWGHGDGVNYQDSWLKIVDAHDVVAEGVLVSKLGFGNGYNTSMIRLENTFPGASGTYRFSNLDKDNITGAMYSDANGTLVSTFTGEAISPAVSVGGKLGVGTSESFSRVDVQNPFPKTDIVQRAVMLWKSNEAYAANPQVMLLGVQGDAALANRSFYLQTAEFGVANGGSLSLQPNLGNVAIGTLDGTRQLDLNGVQRYRGQAAPTVSEANSGTIYFDSATNKLKASLNGSAYVDVIGSGGLTGSGTTGQVAYWDSVTSLASPSGIYVDAVNNRLGINNPAPAYPLDIDGDINIVNAPITLRNGGSPVAVIGALDGSTAIGGVNGTLTTGDTAIGSGALANSSGGGAGSNTAVGVQACRQLTTGDSNTAVGELALSVDTTGSNNVAIGTTAGITNTIGSGNILIGSGADVLAGNLTNAAAIGTGAQIGQSASLNIGGGITRVGIFTPTPKQTLDVTGSVGMHQGIVTLVNGLNSDITLATDNSWIRIEGPTGAFSIGGFITPFNVSDGLILAVYNTVAQQMTIVNEDLASTAINRIKTLTGGDVVLRAGTSAATFRYDAFDDRFILMNSN